MSFSNNLKQLREKSGLTQDDLAKKLFITRQSISKWETESAEPSIEMLLKIAEVFSVSVDELLTGKLPEQNKNIKSEKRYNVLTAVNLGISIFAFLMSFVIVRMLPQTLPMQYDFYGNVSRIGSRWEMLLLGGLPAFLVMLQIWFGKVIKKRPELHRKGLFATSISLIFVNILLVGFLVGLGFVHGDNLPADTIIFISSAFYALMIIISVFSHPKYNKQNAIFGFRTIFTLTDNEAWVKVNKMQSVVGLIASFAAYLITVIIFKEWNIYLMGLIVLSIIPTLIYHEVLRRKKKKIGLKNKNT